MNEGTICILMGVSGSGKSTIGLLLSQRLGWNFYDGDYFHPQENINKMELGIPLTDEDRLPWLLAIRAKIEEVLANKGNAIFACSALKLSYRQLLQENSDRIVWVYLQGSYAEIYQRITQRLGHFMKPELLQSQLETLEIPKDTFTVNISQSPEEIAKAIALYLDT